MNSIRWIRDGGYNFWLSRVGVHRYHIVDHGNDIYHVFCTDTYKTLFTGRKDDVFDFAEDIIRKAQ